MEYKLYAFVMLRDVCQRLYDENLSFSPLYRLGGGQEDAKEVMMDPFFRSMPWQDLLEKKVTPPFKPQVTSDTDTRYFDQEFTGESVELTPPDNGPLNSITEELEQPYFQQFSFHGSTGTLGKSIDQ
ncbi:UNVERIFIED_CONTAM: Akt1 [Trichonephila clavipes]